MADSTVSIRGGPKALSRAMTRTLENVHRAMQRAAVDVARWGVTRMVQESTEKATATAQFKRQWKVVKFPGGAATVNTSPYAEFVERGRGPGKAPPIAAIEAWLKAKGATPRPSPTDIPKRQRRIVGEVTGGKQRARIRKIAKARAKAARASKFRGLALGIARKIAKKGTKPKWLLRDAIDEFIAYARSRYDQAVRRVARNPLGRYPKA